MHPVGHRLKMACVSWLNVPTPNVSTGKCMLIFFSMSFGKWPQLWGLEHSSPPETQQSFDCTGCFITPYKCFVSGTSYSCCHEVPRSSLIVFHGPAHCSQSSACLSTSTAVVFEGSAASLLEQHLISVALFFYCSATNLHAFSNFLHIRSSVSQSRSRLYLSYVKPLKFLTAIYIRGLFFVFTLLYLSPSVARFPLLIK